MLPSDGIFSLRIDPSGARATMSVNVPPVSSATIHAFSEADREVCSDGAGTVGYSARMMRACVAAMLGFALLAGCEGGGVAAPAPEHGASAQSTARADASASPTDAAPPIVPQPAQLGPVHKLTVTDLDGKSVSLAKFAGRPLIIEIWATWCGPCLANRRTVHALKERFPPKVAVIGLSVDAGSDVVRAFFKSNPPNEFEGMASPEFMEFVRTINAHNMIPKTMYVDSKGRVADLSEGTQSATWLQAMAKNLK
jgi:thiol-disulfide isomerase/thioredoxin